MDFPLASRDQSLALEQIQLFLLDLPVRTSTICQLNVTIVFNCSKELIADDQHRIRNLTVARVPFSISMLIKALITIEEYTHQEARVFDSVRREYAAIACANRWELLS